MMKLAAALALLLAPGALATELKATPITRPCLCPAIYAPVCGSDGKTYSNECQIKCTPGVELVSKGPCPTKPPVEPAPCCTKEQPVCMCGGCRTEEVAMQLKCPQIEGETCCKACTKEYAPVCGKDGETYGNECFAKTEGVEVDCKGKCPCEKPPGDCCPEGKQCICGGCGDPLPPNVAVLCSADAPRTCCEGDCTDEWAPVCGVDGKTYGNECEAKGTEIECKGKCPCAPKGDCCGKNRVCCGHKCISKWLAARSFCATAQCCAVRD